MTELYKVPVGGGRTEQVLGTPAEMVCFDKSGKTFLYQDRKASRMNGVNIIPHPLPGIYGCTIRKQENIPID